MIASRGITHGLYFLFCRMTLSKKLTGFLDKVILQFFKSELRPIDQRIPFDRNALQSDRRGSNAIARHRDNHPVDFVCIGLESPRSSVNSDL